MRSKFYFQNGLLDKSHKVCLIDLTEEDILQQDSFQQSISFKIISRLSSDIKHHANLHLTPETQLVMSTDPAVSLDFVKIIQTKNGNLVCIK